MRPLAEKLYFDELMVLIARFAAPILRRESESGKKMESFRRESAEFRFRPNTRSDFDGRVRHAYADFSDSFPANIISPSNDNLPL